MEDFSDAQSLPDIINLYHFPPPAAADQVFFMADQFLIDPQTSAFELSHTMPVNLICFGGPALGQGSWGPDWAGQSVFMHLQYQ